MTTHDLQQSITVYYGSLRFTEINKKVVKFIRFDKLYPSAD